MLLFIQSHKITIKSKKKSRMCWWGKVAVIDKIDKQGLVKGRHLSKDGKEVSEQVIEVSGGKHFRLQQGQ